MSITNLISLVDLKEGVSIGGLLLVILLTLIQITPVKWNPWDSILTWLGKKLNAGVKKEVDELKDSLKEVEKKLDDHITESKVKDLKDTRRDILDFCSSSMNGQRHTQEQYRFVIKKCDEYELYVETNKIKNGEITSAIKEIRRRYDRHIQQNDFLREGED